MRNSNVSNAKRIAAGIIGLMMLVIFLFSAFYIAAEADHDCCGENCPICTCLRECENTLRGVGTGTTSQLSVILPILFALFIAALFVTAIPQGTPVFRKVRLNN